MDSKFCGEPLDFNSKDSHTHLIESPGEGFHIASEIRVNPHVFFEIKAEDSRKYGEDSRKYAEDSNIFSEDSRESTWILQD